jgi:hypothetical protein
MEIYRVLSKRCIKQESAKVVFFGGIPEVDETPFRTIWNVQ